jgi:hypothetical protein
LIVSIDTHPFTRGPQFTSAVWAALCRLLNIQHIPTTAYHPQSNGLVERFHRRLKDALRARAAGGSWATHLPWVMLGIRSAWREGTDFSPAEAVYGAQPILPGQFLAAEEDPSPSFLSDLQGILAGRDLLPTSHHSTPAPQELPEDLLLAKHVLVRRDRHVPPLAAAYDGPFLVLERSLRFFKLQVGDRVDTVSTLRLKACTSPLDVPVAQPPRRGRPPCRHRRANVPTTDYTTKKNLSAASPAPPPRHLPVSCRHTTAVAACTASPPFRPTCPLRRTATAVYGQPRPSPQSTTWGGAVARRHSMKTLSSADPYILFIFSHETFVGSVYIKSEIIN